MSKLMLYLLCSIGLFGCFTDTSRAATNHQTTNNSTSSPTTGSTSSTRGSTLNNGSSNQTTSTDKGTSSGDTTPKTECTSDGDCGGEKCDLAQGVCVACLVEGDCTNGEKCIVDGNDATKNRCGVCAENMDCTMLSASKCGGASTCQACVVDADCSHLVGTPGCNNGVCMECTSDAHCNGKACDMTLNTCSDQDLNSIDTCESCVSDSACRLGSHCLVMSFKGARNGQFCFLEKKNAPNGQCPDERYSYLINRVSVSGYAAADHCGIKEITTCDAVRSAIRVGTNGECSNQSNMPLCDGDGSACFDNNVNPTWCSYICDDNNQCKGLCIDGACG